ncbi:MAG: DNA polymerase III subunit gamma/tau [Algoriella sp.]
MENFVVSARKYRPLDFEDVVGQASITNTLEQAIKTNQLPQALLFCGPRGVGKTTCARILARKINEENGLDGDQDFAFNIFELDAASNNSVDDIRNLIDQVRIVPQIGKYRVYIIDEVHMLSTAAFNAFLKTLEEPPAHAIFILATTEKHKIIPTILSRCQIYDFKRISVEDIKGHLKNVAEKEHVTFEDDALHLIAQKADGALRDSLSILDRMVTFTNKNLTYTSVAENLNVLDYDYYFKMTDACLENDIPQAMLQLNDILNKGFDAHLFISGLGAHFRDLLMAKTANTVSLLEVGERIKAKYLEHAQKCDATFLFGAIEICNEADLNYKASKNPRLTVEIALMQLASLTANENGLKKKKYRIVPPTFYLKEEQQKVSNIVVPNIIQNQVNNQQNTAQTVVKSVIIEQEVKEYTRASKPIKNNGLGSFSLKMALPGNKVEEFQEEILRNDLPREKFTIDQVKESWQKFLDRLKIEHNIPSYNALMTTNLEVIENEIIFEFSSHSSEQEFEVYRDRIRNNLRTQLKNHYFAIQIKLSEKEAENHILSKKDKFQKLSDKNPLLLKLKEEFGLDLYE